MPLRNAVVLYYPFNDNLCYLNATEQLLAYV